MKQFVYGSKKQFDNLYMQLTEGRGKRIWFSVSFPNGGHARLGFESSDGHTVKILLSTYGDEALPGYSGSCELFRELLSGGCPQFSDAEHLRSYFVRARGEYARQHDASENAAEIKPQRIVRQRKAIDASRVAERVKENIIGQDAQVDSIVKSICCHLRKPKPKKPLVMMLAGPTGVGKTETARRIADVLQEEFGKEQLPLIIVKCNEFRESYRISQLLGSPAGYVGHDEPCLMEPIKKSDSAIIVLDEFEKANSEIHTVIMDWMDTGKITLSRIEEDGESAEYDCAASIIILTSNIDMRGGAQVSMRFDLTGDGERGTDDPALSNDDRCRSVMVRNGFKPEIAGRVSKFYEYKPLSKGDLAKIAVLAFKNKFTEYGFVVDEISDELQRDIEQSCAASRFGVRPLENALEETLGEQLPAASEEGAKHLKVGGSLRRLTFTEV